MSNHTMSKHDLAKGRGAGNRHPNAPAQPHAGGFKSHAGGSQLQVQSRGFVPQHFPFQPLPPPNGELPFRFDLSKLLQADDVAKIEQSGKLVFHSVGDTGDERGKQMDFVATMMQHDYDNSPDGAAPAFFYHLGDVVYFAGDIQTY